MSARMRTTILMILAPALILTLVFYVIPSVLTVAMSFTDMRHTLRWNYIGWGNFENITHDPLLPGILRNTLVYSFATVAVSVLFGLTLALATSFVSERVGTFYRAIWLLPRFTPPVVYAVIWLWILDPTRTGILNGAWLAMGGQRPVNWIAEYPMLVIVVVNGFIGVSIGMIIFYSAIRSIPTEYIWASQVDGASWPRQVRHIILPLIRWPLLFVTAYNTLSLFTSYEYILLVTGGGPFFRSTVWALYAYNQAFGGYYAQYEFGYGAALSLVLVVIGAVAAAFYWRVFGFNRMLGEPKIEVD
jgi:inositol-phosphate transport system permease protein